MRRPHRSALIGALVVAGAALAWFSAARPLAEQDTLPIGSQPCSRPVTTDTDGQLSIGPLALTALPANEQVRLELDRRQTRVIVARRSEGSPELTLRITPCDDADPARLLAIGVDGSISVPSTFPDSAGAEVAVLRGEHTRWVVVVLGAHPGRWRLTVSDEERRLGSAVVELVSIR